MRKKMQKPLYATVRKPLAPGTRKIKPATAYDRRKIKAALRVGLA